MKNIIYFVAVLFFTGSALASSKGFLHTSDILQKAEVQSVLTNICFVKKKLVRMSPSNCAKETAREAQELEEKFQKIQAATKNVKDKKKLRRIIEDIEGGASLRLLNLDILEGVNLGLRYKFKVKNSRRRDLKDKFFTRIDRWRIRARLNAGEMLDEDTPVFFGIRQGTEATFAQHFESVGQAYNPKNIYYPSRLPVNSEKAIDRLVVGDYVKFVADLNLMAGASQVWPVGSALEAQAGFHHIMSGTYEIHVFRLPENRVRLKLIGNRGKGYRLSIDAGMDTGDLGRAAKRLVKWTNLDDAFQIELNKAKNDLMLLDYTINLDDERGRKAYDDLLGKPQILTHKILDPRKSSDALVGELIQNAITLEEYSNECATSGMDKKLCPVSRNFKASNRSLTRLGGIKFDIKLFDVGRKRVFRENFLTNVKVEEDGQEVSKQYLFPTLTMISEFGALFDKWDEEVVRSANAVFEAKQVPVKKKSWWFGKKKTVMEPVPLTFHNLGFSLQYTDKVFREKEQRKFLGYIQAILPAEDYHNMLNKLQKEGWTFQDDYEAADILVEYFVRKEALEALARSGYNEESNVREAMKDYLVKLWNTGYDKKMVQKAVKKDEAVGSRVTPARARRHLTKKLADGTVVPHRERLAHLYSSEVSKISKKLARALSADKSEKAAKERYEAFKSLRHSSFFRSVGSRLIVFLVHKAARLDAALSFQDLVYFKADMRTRYRDPFTFEVGSSKKRKLYDLVRFIEAVLNNRDIDELNFDNSSVIANSESQNEVNEDIDLGELDAFMQNLFVVNN